MPEILAKDLMKKTFLRLGPTHTIREALGLYLELKSRNESATVMTVLRPNGHYAGLLTLSRLIKGVLTGAILADLEYIRETDFEKTIYEMLHPRLDAPVTEVMDATVPLATPEHTLAQMLDLTRGRPQECFPVMAENGELTGVVYTSDLFNAVAKLALSRETANP
jgi:Mg/Co/Ni transporter MgtE